VGVKKKPERRNSGPQKQRSSRRLGRAPPRPQPVGTCAARSARVRSTQRRAGATGAATAELFTIVVRGDLTFLQSAQRGLPNRADSRHVEAKFAPSPPPEPAMRRNGASRPQGKAPHSSRRKTGCSDRATIMVYCTFRA
jgi:hypothetical protein